MMGGGLSWVEKLWEGNGLEGKLSRYLVIGKVKMCLGRVQLVLVALRVQLEKSVRTIICMKK